MDFAALKSNKAVWAYLNTKRRAGVYIIEAADEAHFTTMLYKREFLNYKQNQGAPFRPPPAGRRIYKVGAAGPHGGSIGQRLAQYGTMSFPNGFLVHYIGVAGGRTDNSDLYSHKSQVSGIERRILNKLKERGALYHGLNATEWTYESLPELIRLAKAAHTSRGRQFEARGGMLVTTGGQNRFYKDGVSIVDVAEGATISLMPGQSADSSLSQDNAPAPVGIDRAHLRRYKPRTMFPA
jgi:hypothetical protein